MGGGKRKCRTRAAINKSKSKSKSLFVEGGILSGGGSSSSSSRPRPVRGNLNSKAPRNCFGYDYDYDYPSHVSEDVGQSQPPNRPVILLGSKDNNLNIVAFEDPTPCTLPSQVEYTYSYTSDFILADKELPAVDVMDDPQQHLHRGLGFSQNSPPLEEDGDHASMDDDDDDDDVSGLPLDNPLQTSSSNKNSAFVSIGGVRVYTQDISDHEEEEEDEDEEEDDSSDEGSTSETSEDSSDFDSDIDEDIMEDYLDGIGGTSQLYKSEWLHQRHDCDDDSSSDEYGETLRKFSGVALQEASREYGMQKQQSKKKPFSKSSKSKAAHVAWSSALDDLMLVKDPRRLSSKNKHAPSFPQSWPSPSDGRKTKKYGRFPGEKKKHRKERITAKRRERMLNRGVDLEQINSKLKQMVLKNVDMFSFPPMHTRDCSQVQRLAAIYRLRSGCQGSGKKRFVTVSRTQHTSLPSASDEICLEKLIGTGKDDADFPVVDTLKNARSGSARSKSAKILDRHQGGSSSSKSEKKRSGQKPGAYNQPLSFVSSGLIESEITKVGPIGPNDNCNQEDKAMDNSPSTFGSFEIHTKGFGSKMMAKMGYVEGEGLGKEGKGMSQPIEVIQRPKSLGLGMSFVESSNEMVKIGESSSERVRVAKKGGVSARTSTPNIGAFEKHTKGFGSKMMAKMGFVEGMGLGRDSQGMVTPLAAVRRPKARGLGAEGKRC